MSRLNPLFNYTDQAWVIMVSGGPDSMALLELCRQASVRPFVLHVNYNARPTAKRDQMIVEDYCRKYEIYYCIEDGIYPERGNFQAWAREFRYHCAVELVHRFHCEGILTAHHCDDVLETYEMQKQGHKNAGYYGIRREGKMFGVRIVRPLLGMPKADLIDICKNHEVPFGIDESNAKPVYLRNRIRQQLAQQSQEDKQRMIDEISQKNEVIAAENAIFDTLSRQNELHIEDLDDNRQLLRSWLTNHSSRQRFASTFLDEILKQVHSIETFEIDLNSSEKLLVQYRKIRIIPTAETFKITLDTVEYLDYGMFAFAERGQPREGISFLSEDFPITVRNVQASDAIKLSFGTKNILRWCVDRKIPL
ncbi:MAG: tRNA lysidine(34) synthetase TilS, partial [Erysipelotrichales bacterium]